MRSRTSVCRPDITPITTISAITPTQIPPMAMIVIRLRKRDELRADRFLVAR